MKLNKQQLYAHSGIDGHHMCKTYDNHWCYIKIALQVKRNLPF